MSSREPEPAAWWSTSAMQSALFHRAAQCDDGKFWYERRPDGIYVVECQYGPSPSELVLAVGEAETLRGAFMRAGHMAGIWVEDDSEEPDMRRERILVVEAEHPAELNVRAVGSLRELADADEVYVFSDDKGMAIKHRDRDPEDIDVIIRRQEKQ